MKPQSVLASRNKQCDGPITLAFHDFNPATNHFNLVPNDNCCALPVPQNPIVPTTKINLVANEQSTAPSNGEWIKLQPRRSKRISPLKNQQPATLVSKQQKKDISNSQRSAKLKNQKITTNPIHIINPVLRGRDLSSLIDKDKRASDKNSYIFKHLSKNPNCKNDASPNCFKIII